jgi:GGDEF domain-containing protein
VPDENASLLIVEDDLDIAEMLNAYFPVQGYEVRNALRRNTQGTLTNPITGLPEGNLVDERLPACLSPARVRQNGENQGWEALQVALDNLDRFREVYGFVASDDLLRTAALMLHDILSEIGNPTDFLEPYSPAEFLIVTSPETPRRSRNASLNAWRPPWIISTAARTAVQRHSRAASSLSAPANCWRVKTVQRFKPAQS